jgi:trans-aconitate methyltransferase
VDVHAVAAGEIRLLLGALNGRRILDLCCGAGEVFEHLDIDPGLYRGIDYSPEMIAAFRARRPELRLDVADASRFRISDTFDLIMVNSALQYLDAAAVRRLLGNLSAMLAPDGRVLVSNIPRRSLRAMYVSGSAASEPRPASLGERIRGAEALVRRRRVDGLGYWFEPEEIASWGAGEGLRSSVFGSLLYPYRFSLLLTKRL